MIQGGLDTHVGESFREHAESLSELWVLIFKIIDECFDALCQRVGGWFSIGW